MISVGLTGALVAEKYQGLRELGRGPRGTVYLCHDDSEDRPVALKLPHPQLMASETLRTQFWLELVHLIVEDFGTYKARPRGLLLPPIRTKP